MDVATVFSWEIVGVLIGLLGIAFTVLISVIDRRREKCRELTVVQIGTVSFAGVGSRVFPDLRIKYRRRYLAEDAKFTEGMLVNSGNSELDFRDCSTPPSVIFQDDAQIIAGAVIDHPEDMDIEIDLVPARHALVIRSGPIEPGEVILFQALVEGNADFKSMYCRGGGDVKLIVKDLGHEDPFGTWGSIVTLVLLGFTTLAVAQSIDFEALFFRAEVDSMTSAAILVFVLVSIANSFYLKWWFSYIWWKRFIKARHQKTMNKETRKNPIMSSSGPTK